MVTDTTASSTAFAVDLVPPPRVRIGVSPSPWLQGRGAASAVATPRFFQRRGLPPPPSRPTLFQSPGRAKNTTRNPVRTHISATSWSQSVRLCSSLGTVGNAAADNRNNDQISKKPPSTRSFQRVPPKGIVTQSEKTGWTVEHEARRRCRACRHINACGAGHAAGESYDGTMQDRLL
jgi:hypothetical protein